MITGTVQSTEDNIIKVKALNNLYEVDGFFGCGIENNPVVGERVLLINSNGNLYAVGGVNDNISFISKSGERRIYSVNDDEVQAQILWGNDGTLNLNDAETEAVRYDKLLKELNSLKSTVNSLISKFNAHVHVTTATPSTSTTPGTLSPTLSQATSNSSDFTKVKSNNIMLS